MEKDHLFKGKEIDAILKSAARLQNKAERKKESEGEGLSLRELEKIAEEAGIDPNYLREAALLGEDDDDEDKFHIFGAPTTAGKSFSIDRALTKTEREDLVQVFRDVTGADGTAESLENSLMWADTPNRRRQPRLSVNLVTEGEKTVARIKSRSWFMGFIIHYVAILPVLLFGIPSLAEADWPINGLAFLLVLISVLGLAARWGYGKYFNSRMDKVDLLKKAIHKKANDTVSSEKSNLDLDSFEYGNETIEEADHLKASRTKA